MCVACLLINEGDEIAITSFALWKGAAKVRMHAAYLDLLVRCGLCSLRVGLSRLVRVRNARRCLGSGAVVAEITFAGADAVLLEVGEHGVVVLMAVSLMPLVEIRSSRRHCRCGQRS